MLVMFSDDLMIIGLTKLNVERLQTVNPITFKGPYAKPVKDLVIVYGDDKPAILAKLEEGGIEIPQYIRDHARDDPS
jgi:hypothetical protein